VGEIKKSLRSPNTFSGESEYLKKYIEDELVAQLKKYDEPFNTLGVFAEAEIYKLASETPVKVTLDGHGADETLLGYHEFFGYYWRYLAQKI